MAKKTIREPGVKYAFGLSPFTSQSEYFFQLLAGMRINMAVALGVHFLNTQPFLSLCRTKISW
ncbi:hypothetical protein DO021_06380 [Desulfobacter hydrogenophilus]|uniref:Uncharacterized protein n=1 Tax=Desulfobacter hydrogenophilus TaxID=2291 RepID=A0A328FI62_9BACT|nr:hypothetical protein [Desulfobacter hydrogenophilus]NDY71174.1 hypothetical protein [Desulfobacter hydrogenophilus]QBH14226.1 hypothetical protein EYB58_15680 [Desulfobacter hydrogenophilus]RAM02843.1 hypothetical protein DO021_06380 [Desulfobacter hydrogenophilus]